MAQGVELATDSTPSKNERLRHASCVGILDELPHDGVVWNSDANLAAFPDLAALDLGSLDHWFVMLWC